MKRELWRCENWTQEDPATGLKIVPRCSPVPIVPRKETFRPLSKAHLTFIEIHAWAASRANVNISQICSGRFLNIRRELFPADLPLFLFLFLFFLFLFLPLLFLSVSGCSLIFSPCIHAFSALFIFCLSFRSLSSRSLLFSCLHPMFSEIFPPVHRFFSISIPTGIARFSWFFAHLSLSLSLSLSRFVRFFSSFRRDSKIRLIFLHFPLIVT